MRAACTTEQVPLVSNCSCCCTNTEKLAKTNPKLLIASHYNRGSCHLICKLARPPMLICHGSQGASPTASRLSSQHASHGSTPAHTFTGMPAAPTPSMLPKVQHQDQQQQQPSQQNGVQLVQVGYANGASEPMTGIMGVMLHSLVLECLLHACQPLKG